MRLGNASRNSKKDEEGGGGGGSGISGFVAFVVGVLLTALALPILIVAVILPITDCGSSSGPGVTIGDGKSIPDGFKPVFNEAARVTGVNPYLLASVAYQESTMGTGASWKTPNAAGCVGFMQMCIGGAGGNSWGSTVNLVGGPVKSVKMSEAWRLGERPANYPLQTPDHGNYNDPFDATMAGALWLRGKIGGKKIPKIDDTARRALCGYYGACGDGSADYANVVLARARGYEAEDKSSSQAAGNDNKTASVPGTRDVASIVKNPLIGGLLTSAAKSAATDDDDASGSAGKFIWPLATQRTISSPYGPRNSPCAGCSSFHRGIDIPAPEGTPIRAAMAGRVTFRGVLSGYGNYLCVTVNPKMTNCYAHQTRFGSYPLNAVVTQGAVLGYVGHTGVGTGDHLHFEVRLGPNLNSPATDPMPYLNGAASPGEVADGDAGPTSECEGGVPAVDIDGAVANGGGELGYPLGQRGKLLQGSNSGGTHDPGAAPNNWQSDNALDIGVPVGTPVLAAADGVICGSCGFGTLAAGSSSRFAGIRFTLNIKGNQVYYAHLSRLAPGLRRGMSVKRGQVLGYSGTANNVDHLHIGLQNGRPETLFGFQ